MRVGPNKEKYAPSKCLANKKSHQIPTNNLYFLDGSGPFSLVCSKFYYVRYHKSVPFWTIAILCCNNGIKRRAKWREREAVSEEYSANKRIAEHLWQKMTLFPTEVEHERRKERTAHKQASNEQTHAPHGRMEGSTIIGIGINTKDKK